MEQRKISWKHLVIHTLILVGIHVIYLLLGDKYTWAKCFVSQDYTLYMWMVIFFLDIFGKHYAGSALVAAHVVFALFTPLYQVYVLNRRGITIQQVGNLWEYSRQGVVYDVKEYYTYFDSGSFYICCIVVALIVNAVRRSGKET